MMKKFLSIPLAVVLLAALIFGGCKAAPPAREAILVGSVTSLTGAFSGSGIGGDFGVRAAVEDINKQGGVYVEEYGKRLPIKLITLNNESDPIKAGTLAEDLIVREKVDFHLTGMEPPFMRAPVATVAERYKVPHITGIGPYEAWMGLRMEVTPPWQYTWAMGFAIASPMPPGDFREDKPGYAMVGTWKATLDKYGPLTNKKVAAVASDEPDGRGWYMAMTPAIEEWGYDIYKDEEGFGLVPPDTTDFSSLIKEWKDNNCEILWGNSPAAFWGTMSRQARALGYKPKIAIATRAGLFYSDVAAWGGDLPNAVGNEILWHPSIKEFQGIGDTTPMSLLERWTKATGEPIQQFLGIGYTPVQVLIDAIERAGTLDRDAVNKAIGETDLMTIYHRVVFDPKDQFNWYPVTFGQWVKTDKPWVWENPIVFSEHEFMPATAEFIFPIPYD